MKLSNAFKRLVVFCVLSVFSFSLIFGQSIIFAETSSNNWTGKWVTDDAGRVYNLIQDGNNVTGKIDDEEVTISGKVSGNVLTAKWSDPQKAAPENGGDIIFTMSADGKYCLGKWKYGSDANNDDWYEFTGTKNTAIVRGLKIDLKTQVVATGVELTWNDDSTGSLIQGYNIYRSTKLGNEGDTPVNSTPIGLDPTTGKFKYTDELDATGTYYYICKAVFKDQSMSLPSNEATAQVSNITKTIVLHVNNPVMQVNGVERKIDDNGTAPVVVAGGRTIVPIRAIVESLGGTAEWDGDTRKATISHKSKKIELWIGKTDTTVNGAKVTTDVAPQIVNSRTMLPLRFITENLGCTVGWEPVEKKITITYEIN